MAAVSEDSSTSDGHSSMENNPLQFAVNSVTCLLYFRLPDLGEGTTEAGKAFDSLCSKQVPPNMGSVETQSLYNCGSILGVCHITTCSYNTVPLSTSYMYIALL